MRQKIIYTLQDRKTVVQEDHLYDQAVYFRQFYDDIILQKVEKYVNGKFSRLEIYLYDECITDEEMLFEYVMVQDIIIIRTQLYGKEKLLHQKQYLSLILKSEKFEVRDDSDRVVSFRHIVDGKPESCRKIRYDHQGSAWPIDYLASGNPQLKKSGLEEQICEFPGPDDREASYYLSFFPFLKTGESVEVAENRYFFTRFGDDIEITLQQAFFSKAFSKKIFINGIHQRSDHFVDHIMIARSYYLYDEAPLILIPEDAGIKTSFHRMQKKDGFTRWEILSYDRNIFENKEIKVFDILGKEIFFQGFDHRDRAVYTRKSAYYDGSYAEYEPFMYDENGAMSTEFITIDDGWSGEDIYISDLRKSGFFNSDYGKYYLSALPEIPDSRFLIKSYREIYRNHLDETITQEEAEALYEYSKEVYHNDLPVAKTTFKALSRQAFKEKRYFEYTETYHPEVREIRKLEDFYEGGKLMYYNRRIMNTYTVYDFLIRDPENFLEVKFSGTVVFDNHYRIISKMTRRERTETLVSGQKIFYHVPDPEYLPVAGSSAFVKIIFNSQGDIETYEDPNRYNSGSFSKEKYQDDFLFTHSPLNTDYYKALEPLVPEEKDYPFSAYQAEELYFQKEDMDHPSVIHLLYSESGLKIAIDDYCYYYFIAKDEDLCELPVTGTNFSLVFSHIRKTSQSIKTECLFDNKIRVNINIDLDSRTIRDALFENNEDGKLSFRKIRSYASSDVYALFSGDMNIGMIDFYSELVTLLLLKA